MRILFIVDGTYALAYFGGVVQEFIRRNHEITLMCETYHGEEVERQNPLFEEFRSNENVVVRECIKRSGKVLCTMRKMINYLHYADFKEQSRFYEERYFSYLRASVNRFFLLMVLLVGKIGILRKTMKSILLFLHKLAPCDRRVFDDLKQIQPDIVVAGPRNRDPSAAFDYIQACKKMHIKNVILNLSWDTITSKGFYFTKPYHFIVWNDIQRADLTAIYHIGPACTYISGAPLFDYWFDKPPDICDSFYGDIGIQRKKYILYLGSSNIFEDESDVVNEISRYLQEQKPETTDPIKLVVKPHPSGYKNMKNLNDGITVYPKQPPLGMFENNFYNELNGLITGALLVVGLNTSAMVDAIMSRKVPCATILHEKSRKVQYDTIHFRQLYEAGILEKFASPRDLVEFAYDLLQGQPYDMKKIMEFAFRFGRPLSPEISASTQVVNIVEDIAEDRID